MQNQLVSDSMHVAAHRAAGVEVHKMQLTAAVRLYGRDGDDGQASIRVFGTDRAALKEFTAWLKRMASPLPSWMARACTGLRPCGRWRTPRFSRNWCMPSM